MNREASMRHGSTISTVLVGLGLIALGVGGFNLVTAGCPLGICRTAAHFASTSASPASLPRPACGSDCTTSDHAHDKACCKGEGKTEGECCGECPPAESTAGATPYTNPA